MTANLIGITSAPNFSFSSSKGGGIDLGASLALMDAQSRHYRSDTQWLNENGWKHMRTGLINADYNPILAIGQSPMQSPMVNATATQPTQSSSFSMDGASSMNANTARKVSDSQISMNKATANKLVEEALTQQNVRANYDSQTLLNMITSDRISKLLPYELRQAAAQIAVLDSTARLNNTTAEYVPYNAETGRISSNAQAKNADTNAHWTPAKIVGGMLAGLGLGSIGKVGKVAPYLKNAKAVKPVLGNNKFLSSAAKYFTTLH